MVPAAPEKEPPCPSDVKVSIGVNQRTEQTSDQRGTGPAADTAAPDKRRLDRIRTRSSYLLFQQLYDLLNAKPEIPEVLRRLYDILDAKGVFGSERNAAYAAESLGMLLRDIAEAGRVRGE